MTTQINYSQIKGAVINALDYGAGVGGDVTTQLQAAITAAANKTLYLPAGTYSYSSLTIASSMNIIGDGRNTILSCNSATGGMTVTATTPAATPDVNSAVIFEKLLFTASGTQTGGAFISLAPSTEENMRSVFRDVTFLLYFRAIKAVRASLWTVDNCYFGSAIGVTSPIAVYIENQNNVDSGDNTICNSTFSSDNSTGECIRHISSGGLRILNNKMISSSIHYHMVLGSTVATSDLIIIGNSMEFPYGSGSIIFDSAGGGATFNNVQIASNQFSVGYTVAEVGQYCINVSSPGSAWLSGVSIVDNIFGSNFYGTCVGMNSTSVVTIRGNVFRMQTGSTGFAMENYIATVDIGPQNLEGLTTAYSGILGNNSVSYVNQIGKFVDIPSGAGGTFVITLPYTMVYKVALIALGGEVATIGTVSGLYVSSSATVVAVSAIANMTVTQTATAITVTNNTTHAFEGKILITI